MADFNLADIAAVAGNDTNNNWILILLFAMICIGNGFNRSGDFGQFATSASQSEILLGQQFQNLGQAVNSIGDGICSSTYALDNDIHAEGRAIQNQLAECCCTTQRNIDSLRFDMANYSSAIQANDTANTQKILDAFCQDKIESLQAKVSELQNTLTLQQQMCGVPRINPYMYGISPNYCPNGNI